MLLTAALVVATAYWLLGAFIVAKVKGPWWAMVWPLWVPYRARREDRYYNGHKYWMGG